MSCTVLAIYAGMVLKMLTRRQKDEARKTAKKPESRARRILRALILAVGMGTLTLVIDTEVRDTAVTFLSDLGIISLEAQEIEL